MYVLDENTAPAQTTDSSAHRGRDPFLYDRSRAANALSDVYAMGGSKLAPQHHVVRAQSMDDHAVQEIQRAAATTKAYEAGAITGGHTIQGAERFTDWRFRAVHPKRCFINSMRKAVDADSGPPLGVGVLTTAKADLVEKVRADRIYRQMAALNKAAYDVMVKYPVLSRTDVTGFVARPQPRWHRQRRFASSHDAPSGAELHRWAEMGLIPAGAVPQPAVCSRRMCLKGKVSRTLQDLFS